MVPPMLLWYPIHPRPYLYIRGDRKEWSDVRKRYLVVLGKLRLGRVPDRDLLRTNMVRTRQHRFLSRIKLNLIRLVILITMFIYIRAGGEIYKKRKQLRNFGASSSGHDPEPLTMDDPFSVKTTEVTVTSESAAEDGNNGIDLAPLGRFNFQKKTAYSVTISSDKKGNDKTQQVDFDLPVQNNVPPTPSSATKRGKTQKRRANYEASNAAWSYSKCAILFFTALLVTWIPSSANRVYGIVNGNQVSPALEIMSAIVLPLQGFWNMLIYIATSWEAVRITFSDIRSCGSKRHPEPSQYSGDHNDKRNFAFRLGSRSSRTDIDSDSVTELTNSGRTSHANHDGKGLAV